MDSLEALRSGQLAGQTRLQLSANLKTFPLEILTLADSLEILDLSNNSLEHLPAEFSQLQKLKIVFLSNNQFKRFPKVLAHCPELSMVSFKDNQLKEISPQAFPPQLRWLILTGNRLKQLPASMGNLPKLQKLMLAGNQLQSLPQELSACHNLELIRLANNQLQQLPNWLGKLPRLAWVNFAGNPCSQSTATAIDALPKLNPDQIQQDQCLGQGASGVIYQGVWQTDTTQSQAVAIKFFKGQNTSDGSPLDEMRACAAAGQHPNLVTVLGKLDFHQRPDAALVFDFVPPSYGNLGNPPSLASCTRDTYDANNSLTLPVLLRIVTGAADAIAHLHQQGILHGDFYAHNILVDAQGDCRLGDFGAASFYDPKNETLAQTLEQIEARAFGCLLEDLLDHCLEPSALETSAIQPTPEAERLQQLRSLQQACLDPTPSQRPSFDQICQTLNTLKAKGANV